MKIFHTPIEGLIVIELKKIEDSRGSFCETYSQKEFSRNGIYYNFVQDNESISIRNTIRGLHYQDFPEGQVKLVRCTRGKIFDVAVDCRSGSETFGHSYSIELSESNNRCLLIPKGFLHGFCVTDSSARVNYKCSWFYEPTLEKGIIYNDPDLKIPWPIKTPILSDKDLKNPRFRDVFVK
jgi:dTDP-4-dehydrorhamnose 3,5-epimerase